MMSIVGRGQSATQLLRPMTNAVF